MVIDGDHHRARVRADAVLLASATPRETSPAAEPPTRPLSACDYAAHYRSKGLRQSPRPAAITLHLELDCPQPGGSRGVRSGLHCDLAVQPGDPNNSFVPDGLHVLVQADSRLAVDEPLDWLDAAYFDDYGVHDPSEYDSLETRQACLREALATWCTPHCCRRTRPSAPLSSTRSPNTASGSTTPTRTCSPSCLRAAFPTARVPCPRAVGGIRSVPSAGPAHQHPRKQTWRFTLGMLHPCSMRLNVRARDRDTAIRKAFAKARRERTRRQQDSPGTQPFVAIPHAPGNTRPSPAPAQRLRGRRPACRHRAARGPRQHAFTRTHE